MAGYFKADAEFRSIVSDFASKINKEIPVPVEIFFIDNDSITKYQNPISKFSSDLLLINFADGISTQIDKSLYKMSSFINDTTVIVYISDLILSGNRAQIDGSINRQFNVLEADNTLRKSIYEIFYDSIVNKNFDTQIFQFTSKFTGNYFDFKNRPIRLDGKNRPYYITIIGSEYHITTLSDKLYSFSFFKDNLKNTAIFSKKMGINETETFIYPNIQKKGKWLPTSALKGTYVLKNINPERDDTCRFLMSFNFNKMNVNLDDQLFNRLLTVNGSNCSVAFHQVSKSNITDKDILNKAHLEKFESATNFVAIDIIQMNLDTARINIGLNKLDQAWVNEISTMADTTIVAMEGKTFAFSYFVKGLNEAYNMPSKSLSFDIILKNN
ncbi:MAG: hypothetical protein IPH74_00950 [Bacteroidetes bacterium]|nr:hypothetical protein [Bacteroidota bacterium]